MLVFGLWSCDSSSDIIEDEVEQQINEQEEVEEEEEIEEEVIVEEEIIEVEGEDYFLPYIDLSNWKVTLPIGSPDEVEPPEILDYATDERLLPYMYNDSTDGSLVFYTSPGSSTANSSYSRTELREQMVPGSNSTNWTFSQGGRMKGILSVPEITTDVSGEYHRTLVMQIHGRLTNEQRDLIGEDDNNAPPVLKVYWQKGKVRVLTKKLKDEDSSSEEILHTDAWEDNEGYTFSEEVGANKFTLEVIASSGRLEVILNDTDAVVYEDIHMEKWSVFENYFKAGNYLQTLDTGASAKVKYYELEVTH
ncbi:MAG TPA: polysaccharide lyase family 7 protein [Maribacter sp.]|nr:polysaccharide lyase family 7 protein [Maribacter sp.]HEA78905.1 polysaccharide lyase family 7 protein [Maribacter sp.]